MAAAVIAAGSIYLTTAHTNNTVQASTSALTKTPKTTTQDELYKPGDTVAFQTLTLKVNSVTPTQELSTAHTSPIAADSGTKFIVVNMTVNNTTQNPFIFQSFVLTDQQGRTFSSYDKTFANVDNYLTLQQLEPSIPVTGNDVYQVPSDATSFKLGGEVGNTGTFKYVQFNL